MPPITVTTLNIAPQHFWLIVVLVGVALGSLVLFVLLDLMGKPAVKHRMLTLKDVPLAIAIVFGVLWIGILCLTLWFIWVGLWGMIMAPPGGMNAATPDGAGKSALTLGLIAAAVSAPFFLYGMWLKHRTVEFQKEGHITDRINKAVEMLGAEKTVKVQGDNGQSVERTVPNIEVRIGALLALERIAQDSTRYDFGRDHVRVMEILCAYMRENSPAPRDLNEHQPPDADQNTRSRTDIALCVDVIKRRNGDQREIKKAARYRLDLRRVDFSGCDLSNGNFDGALMMRGYFLDTKFSKSNLTATDLSYSKFINCFFYKSTIKGTVLDFCTCHDGYLFLATWIHSASIVGAKIPDTMVSRDFGERVFGNVETIFKIPDNGSKPENSQYIAKLVSAYKSGSETLKHYSLDPRFEHCKAFLYWSEYEAIDGAINQDRADFNRHHNLTGWPFDDT